MPRYRKNEARDWARVHMTGCDNVIIPSYTADLRALNEKGIRHDVRRCIELGFSGSLLVSEVNITLDEYRQFAEWAVDEAKGKLRIVHHASWNTLEENIEAARITQGAGADYVLMSYPANFYPSSLDEVYDYTKAYCDAIDLGVMLFPVPLWNFGRLHASDIPPKMLRKMVDTLPNIIAIKAEGALPSIAGLLDVYRQFKDVVISCPLEKDIIPLMAVMDFQYSGTSNTEYYGDRFPRMFNLAREKKMDEAMDLYWKNSPARRANEGSPPGHGAHTNFIHRQFWKFQGWLQGMNGGPMRQPGARLNDGQMAALRKGLVDAGFPPVKESNRDFFVGRNPVETARAAARRAA
jgi:4-hydroxy-tetrahydrodipicolinate synthase